jgi:hypothetical protein
MSEPIVYLIQITPLLEPDFLESFGEIVYKTDYISSLYGVKSEMNLIEQLEGDSRVIMVSVWEDFNFSI